ncbi:MAG TPA: ATP-dependent DNA helicase [Acetobacteraceae bacterium]|nr:ATP-dependent DNA helicase [Acetobacteraceae bacterium]
MPAPALLLPEAPAIVAGHGRAAVLTVEGELLTLSQAEAAPLVHAAPPLLVHAPATLGRLGLRPMPAYDLLELFAFVLPARPVAPTPRGLALALDLDPPQTREDAAALLPELATVLLRRLATARHLPLNAEAAGLAARMGQAGWGWAPSVLAALGKPGAAPAMEGYRVWRRLPEWEEIAPPPPPAAHPVQPAEARARLAEILGPGAEQRPGQADYASAASAAFAPRAAAGDPRLVLAEAGTGTGKTLGYIAPASLWAERNGGAVWISTYTKHLQRQIDAELTRLYPDPAERRRRVVVRKGRENYLCLLNLEGAVNTGLGGAGAAAIPLGLIARWAQATADGDIQGGDLPGWFGELFGLGLAAGLADRRGECIHGACPHYRRCFVEHTIRRARTASLVVANHALVMAQASWGGLDDTIVPTRYVFDEGHHLFEAADSAFAADLSGIEMAELRRWLLGAEGGSSRARGLRRRLEDLVAGKPELEAPLDAALQAARALPPPGWSLRLGEAEAVLVPVAGEAGQPNPAESFLRVIRQQVLARAGETAEAAMQPGLECDLHPLDPALPEHAARLERALARLAEPLGILRRRLLERLEDEAEELDSAFRSRIEGAGRSLGRRAIDRLGAWREILRVVQSPAPEPGQRPEHVHILHLLRRDGQDRDAGLRRHWLDPTIPFALSLAVPAHGLLVTSATLRDGHGDDAEAAWERAEARIGASHLPSPALRAAVASPFDYARQSRVFVVNDVPSGQLGALAGAYRALFLAAGGGGLGLFTAISRLRAVHERIAPALEEAGIPLLAQHVDAMDNATLVDVFRTEAESCLLGTDAMRDGVDVPGRALRLVVFERVPWPRPDILHRERRIHLSGGDTGGFDERVARLRLRQAFGRLIRNAGDHGVFVLLDRRTPTRLLSAFPAGAPVRRVGLAEAVAETRAFLAEAFGPGESTPEEPGPPA